MKTQPLSADLQRQHLEVTRRYFLGMGAAGLAAVQGHSLWAGDAEILADATEDLEYLTYAKEFGTVERGKPLPYTLPLEKRLEIGLERKTWKLEVIGDAKSNSALSNPLTRAKGNALDFPALMKLAEKHAVRFLKIMSCNNMSKPLGMGLWEGVPLREVRLETMESRTCPGLHLIGEILDVDGRIGGFNFQWAWSTGYIAGSAAAKPQVEKARSTK